MAPSDPTSAACPRSNSSRVRRALTGACNPDVVFDLTSSGLHRGLGGSAVRRRGHQLPRHHGRRGCGRAATDRAVEQLPVYLELRQRRGHRDWHRGQELVPPARGILHKLGGRDPGPWAGTATSTFFCTIFNFFKLYTAPHAPCKVFPEVHVLIRCWMVLAIQ